MMKKVVRYSYLTKTEVSRMTGLHMPEYKTICAAVAGEKWAVEKVLECYSNKLDKFATVEKRQPDGSMKKEIDKDMRQALALKLMEAISQFPLEMG